VVDPGTWEEPRIFGEIRAAGDIAVDEMRKVFNLGIGMVVVVRAAQADKARRLLEAAKVRTCLLGEVVRGDGDVEV